MEIKQLKSFAVVYETQSLNRAAGQLFITPQGLSKSIRQLEEELGVTLFQRSQRGMEPTAGGELLYERSRELLARLEAVERELSELDDPKARLRLGIANGVFNVVPFRTVLRFARAHEDVRLEFIEYSNGEVKQLLRAAKLEYGLVVGCWDEPGVVSRRIGGCDVCLLVYEGHPLFGREKVNLGLLREEPLITMNEKFHMYHDFFDACQVRGFSPKIIAKTADANFQHKLCREKLGLAVVPSFFAESFSMSGLRVIPFEEGLRWEVYSAYLQSRGDLPAIRALDAWLAESLLVFMKS